MVSKPRKPPGVKEVLLFASGKGGVGKSTVCYEMALAFKRKGARVGILDADIYGPSQPHLNAGPLGEKIQVNADKKFIPYVTEEGLLLNSMGLLVSPEQALVWRGPMVSSALMQLLFDSIWSDQGQELDYLCVDCPPGTGDILLSLTQKLSITGVVLVSTASPLALLDAEKALAMFRRCEIPVLGCVDNMSRYPCTHCGHLEELFEGDGVKAFTEKHQIPLLGVWPWKVKNQSDSVWERLCDYSAAACIAEIARLPVKPKILSTVRTEYHPKTHTEGDA